MLDDRTLARFMAKIDKTETCWLWTAQLNKGGSGYGKFRISGKYHLAHRVAYQHWNGPIPPGMYVCHRCDVTHCVNHSHLFLGSPAQNTDDAAEKGRLARGSRVGTSLLTASEARAIRADTREQSEIAASHGVSVWAVQDIKRRRTWDWLE